MSLTKLSATPLEALTGVAHGYYTRQGGISGGIYASLNGGMGSSDDAGNVVENRSRIAGDIGAAHLVTLFQCHSADVVAVDGPFDGDAPKADAMVTRTPGVALGILTADCGPLLFADPEAGVIGAAHAGWGGAFKGVIAATVDAMEGLGAERGRILAALGPTLARKSYEVGPEFVERFTTDDAENARFFVHPEGAPRPYFDLPGYIARQAGDAGVRPENYTDLGRDTYADEDLFYSYRRSVHRNEPDYGRLVAAIMLTER
ncbi:MAG: peptidoglycan editing factor PgeF [Minwuia sp.]|uniref:peptidoglycan editing factor PgeF n=1 Tax=Minwuia sp. TaxID=2493630 RepID=UPI003A8C4890